MNVFGSVLVLGDGWSEVKRALDRESGILGSCPGHKLCKGPAYKESTKHRLCSHGTPTLMEETETEDRIPCSRDQDELRVVQELREEGCLPSLQSVRSERIPLPVGGDAPAECTGDVGSQPWEQWDTGMQPGKCRAERSSVLLSIDTGLG